MQSPTTRARDANCDDVEALTDLAAQVQTLHAEGRPDLFRPADPEALRGFLTDRLADDSLVLLAEDEGGKVIGYLFAALATRPQSPFQLAHTSMYVHHIAVDESARRQHVGKLLMDEIVERARQSSASTIRLDSWSFNTDAHRFFEAQGFAASRIILERPLDAEPPVDVGRPIDAAE